jgi:hypothetical protein
MVIGDLIALIRSAIPGNPVVLMTWAGRSNKLKGEGIQVTMPSVAVIHRNVKSY